MPCPRWAIRTYSGNPLGDNNTGPSASLAPTWREEEANNLHTISGLVHPSLCDSGMDFGSGGRSEPLLCPQEYSLKVRHLSRERKLPSITFGPILQPSPKTDSKHHIDKSFITLQNVLHDDCAVGLQAGRSNWLWCYVLDKLLHSDTTRTSYQDP